MAVILPVWGGRAPMHCLLEGDLEDSVWPLCGQNPHTGQGCWDEISLRDSLSSSSCSLFWDYPTPDFYYLEVKQRIMDPQQQSTPVWGGGAQHPQCLPSVGYSDSSFHGRDLHTEPQGCGETVTWLLFSAWLFLLESGKWMWQPVSSITFLMLLPPLPMTWECSVCETSIFNVTRLLCAEAGLFPDALTMPHTLPLTAL